MIQVWILGTQILTYRFVCLGLSLVILIPEVILRERINGCSEVAGATKFDNEVGFDTKFDNEVALDTKLNNKVALDTKFDNEVALDTKFDNEVALDTKFDKKVPLGWAIVR